MNTKIKTVKTFFHLKDNERILIDKYYNQEKYSIYKISKLLKRDYKTISTEIKKYSFPNNHYDWQYASLKKYKHHQKIIKQRKSYRILAQNPSLLNTIVSYLKQDYSPEIISKSLLDKNEKISHETIYSYIYYDKSLGGKLYKYLANKHKKRHKRVLFNKKRCIIKYRVPISKRDKQVLENKTFGHWEADLVTYGDGYILSITERKSLYTLISKLPNKKSKIVKRSIINLLTSFSEKGLVKTITFDNGTEFSKHYLVAKKLNCRTYFCQPYCWWEKARVENINKMIRRFIPKSSLLTSFSPNRIKSIQEKLAHYPRKSFLFKSSYEILFKSSLLDFTS